MKNSEIVNTNLNDLCHRPGDDDDDDYTRIVYSFTPPGHVATDMIDVYLYDIKDALISAISKYDTILGCVAWLTDFDIINSMKNKNVCIVVQKEDFLRPDYGVSQTDNQWRQSLRDAYKSLSPLFPKHSLRGTVISACNRCGDLELGPVLCMGNHNSARVPAFPRMHHKFLILGNMEYTENGEDCTVVPKAVWTGSYNFTQNAGRSRENALLIRVPEIVGAYYKEFGEVVSYAEPLDWTSRWVEPYFRIGT